MADDYQGVRATPDIIDRTGEMLLEGSPCEIISNPEVHGVDLRKASCRRRRG